MLTQEHSFHTEAEEMLFTESRALIEVWWREIGSEKPAKVRVRRWPRYGYAMATLRPRHDHAMPRYDHAMATLWPRYGYADSEVSFTTRSAGLEYVLSTYGQH